MVKEWLPVEPNSREAPQLLVFWKERLVFLAVPKTGTQAYAAALAPHAGMVITDPPELKHAPVYRYNRFIRPMFEKVMDAELELMAVIREPVSWLGSWYRYRRRPFMAGRPGSTHEVDFDTFVEGWMHGERPEYANVGSQAKFVEARPNGCRVSHFFRYEQQDRLDAFLSERLGVAIEVPRRNVSPQEQLSLSAAIEKRLRRKCAEEFELWENSGA